jgi:hypothetical protein
VGNIKITFRSPTEGGGATADPSSRDDDHSSECVAASNILARVYESGKVTVMGSRSEADSRSATVFVASLVKYIGVPIESLLRFNIVCLSANTELPVSINLPALKSKFSSADFDIRRADACRLRVRKAVRRR